MKYIFGFDIFVYFEIISKEVGYKTLVKVLDITK